jgi:hypothetical protein
MKIYPLSHIKEPKCTYGHLVLIPFSNDDIQWHPRIILACEDLCYLLGLEWYSKIVLYKLGTPDPIFKTKMTELIQIFGHGTTAIIVGAQKPCSFNELFTYIKNLTPIEFSEHILTRKL